MKPDVSIIFTPPPVVDADTLDHLGPLAALAGVWEGTRGEDLHPTTDGPAGADYVERYELHPIDPQTNGPQLLYGLRYHVHITRPGARATFHDQVGYWLWEPATDALIHTLTIPRGQVVMAGGSAGRDAKSFEVRAEAGSPTFGICSNPFLQQAFRTLEFRLRVAINPDGSWSYEQDTVLRIQGNDQLFHHVNRNTLRRIGAPVANPSARATA